MIRQNLEYESWLQESVAFSINQQSNLQNQKQSQHNIADQ
jgi:hypothetical protein